MREREVKMVVPDAFIVQGVYRDWGDGKISDAHMEAAQRKATGQNMAAAAKKKMARKLAEERYACFCD